jgi:uncharacterized protein YndB with AHSA1/START domain
MSIETANYITELDLNWPKPIDPISEGDNHIRLIKKVLGDTFPNAYEAVNGVHTGATEPTQTSSGQLWYDTSTNLVMVRNAGDDGWEPVSFIPDPDIDIVLLNRKVYNGVSLSTIRESDPTETDMKVIYTKIKPESLLSVTWRCDCQTASSFATSNRSVNYANLYVDGVVDNVVPPESIEMIAVDAEAARPVGGSTSTMSSMGTFTWEIADLEEGERDLTIYGSTPTPLDGWAGYTQWQMIVEEWKV